MNQANGTGDFVSWAAGASAGMNQGMTVIPYALLRYYRTIGLNSSECMLLIHLLGFQQVEHKGFPSLEELQQVTGATTEMIAMILQKLMKEGLLGIDEHVDEERGIQYERYNLSGLYAKLGHCLAEESKGESEGAKAADNSRKGNNSASLDTFRFNKPAASKTTPVEEERNLFSIFEKEFGRPLSPMELETISGWVDQDRYPDELILLALKEAVFAGKVHFRYIDRILLEWSRNRVRTAQDAKAYTQKFRNIGR
ncbi:DNA replication protein DnaD [Paenibacillus uliginis N3/975]|uniref:DNA replication protein DnaD n=1 Tax=Paenibacillus uliginis N3/975 TaxID=1313296 RepID=A0A1X7HIJ7_9BACL|nr:DnaD domain-containing protein [Paenibacillus uliginis]SMF87266.1 DNA replication protein DnaD [Paenibacillus uliginis N3/975]